MGRRRREGAGRATRPCPQEARAVQASAGGHRGSERRVGRATTGATRHAPLPSRGTSAAPRACAVLATCLRRGKDSEGAPPPPTPYSPTHQGKGRGQRGGGEGTWGGDRGQTDVPGEVTGGERWRKKNNHEQSIPTRQRKKARRRGPKPRRTGGGRGDMGPQGTLVKNPTTGIWGPQRENPPPPPTAAASPSACVVLASCLRHACYKGKTTRATRGMTVAESGPPPENTAAGWGGSGTRVRDEPHDRAQREHAPCKPQRGNHRGCDRRKGRVTTGATRQAPPPQQRDKCRASCLRRACDVLTPEDGQRGRPPPPAPFSSTHPTKGRGQRGDSEGTWGGAEDRPKRRGERREASKKKQTKKNNKGHQHARAGAGSRGTRDMAGARKHGKGRGKGGRPWGRKLGGRDQRRNEGAEGGVTRARKRRW